MKSIALYYSEQSEKNDETNSVAKGVKLDANDTLNQDGSIDATLQKDDTKNKDEADVELHMNLWKVEEKICRPFYRFYMDFGIMFPKKYRRLCLFLPFEIREDYPIDLAKVLINDQQTLSAVFNADIKFTSRVNDNYCTVTYDNEEFSIYHLGNSNFKKSPHLEDNEKGVYLEISIVDDSDNTDIKDKIYVRFRVSLADNNQLVKTEHISNDLLQAAFSKTDLFDIRVNEIRVLNSKVKENMNREGFHLCKFSKVHLFFMTDSRETVCNGSSLNQDTRMLESDQWDGYMPHTDLDGTSFIAYHWKRRRKIINSETKKYDIPPIETFSVYFSTIYPKAHFWRLVSYLIVVIIMGWIGSMLSFDVASPNWVKMTIVVGLLVLLCVLVCRSTFGITWFKIYRKR